MKRGWQNMSQKNKRTEHKLPQIPPRHRAKVQALVQRRCANYDKKNCLLLDDWMPCVCPQYSARVLNCKYFRSIVINGTIPSLQYHLLMLADVLIVCGLGAWMYKKNNTKFLYYV